MRYNQTLVILSRYNNRIRRTMLARNLLYAYLDTQCLFAINQLNIADLLVNGPLPISEIAQFCSVDDDKLYRIMRYLSCKGLFDELPNKYFTLNSASQDLLSIHDGNIKDLIAFHADSPYQAAKAIITSLSEDDSPFSLTYGSHVFEYLNNHEEAEKHFHSAMQQNASIIGKNIIKSYDFSPYTMIVDIGGGTGSLLVHILQANPNSHGINFDIPKLQQRAESLLKEQNLENRCKFVAGSFFETIPPGGDLYLMKAILHGKHDELAIKLLKKCYMALPPNGKLLLIERVINKKYDYLDGCTNDINMLNLTQGKERTMLEYETLLNQSGLHLQQCIQVDASLCILEIIRE